MISGGSPGAGLSDGRDHLRSKSYKPSRPVRSVTGRPAKFERLRAIWESVTPCPRSRPPPDAITPQAGLSRLGGPDGGKLSRETLAREHSSADVLSCGPTRR